MTQNRFDETWHRLLEWTKGQTPSERLAAQILIHEGYQNIDPSHPLGGKDGGKDALALKDGSTFVMGVYFPRGHQDFRTIKNKFVSDCAGASSNRAVGFAFVTNQELTLAQREELKNENPSLKIEIFHLERITAILDSPGMSKIREQFLEIEANSLGSIQLGGQGGQAPGAGGGGGAAIGPDAIGGPGGPGGDYIVLDGTPGTAPGAGGGGAGIIGEGAIGGEAAVVVSA